MNRVQILHLFLTDGTDQSERKCFQLSGARPVLDFYTLVCYKQGLPRLICCRVASALAAWLSRFLSVVVWLLPWLAGCPAACLASWSSGSPSLANWLASVGWLLSLVSWRLGIVWFLPGPAGSLVSCGSFPGQIAA